MSKKPNLSSLKHVGWKEALPPLMSSKLDITNSAVVAYKNVVNSILDEELTLAEKKGLKSINNVVIKPNLVVSKFNNVELNKERADANVTNPYLIRAVYEYFVGMGCRVLIAETPLSSTDLSYVTKLLGIDDLPLLDIRSWIDKSYILSFGKYALCLWRRVPAFGDPSGYSTHGLTDTYFDALLTSNPDKWRFHNSVPKPRKLVSRGFGHRYGNFGLFSFPNTVLDADLVINLPKLKTHMKAGFTAARKSLIGLVNEKEWLAHYTVGKDDYPKGTSWWEKFRSRLGRFPLGSNWSAGVRFGKDTVKAGTGIPNNTLLRTIAELNDVYDEVGPPTLNIIDAGVVGHGNGPLNCTPLYNFNTLFHGWNRKDLDLIAATKLLESSASFPGEWREFLQQIMFNPDGNKGNYASYVVGDVKLKLER